jgi:DNA-binding transcriptional MocR family regulator
MSKVSFASAGLAMFAGSEINVAWLRTHRSKQTIGPDKLTQLRHVRLFRDMEGIAAHMKKHAAILKPKFNAVDQILAREIGGKGLAEWTRPLGGYFVRLDVVPGTARAVVKMAGEVGVKLTEAGAAFPYGQDPDDRNLRIAPSLPKLPEIETAMAVVALCVQRAALDKLAR